MADTSGTINSVLDLPPELQLRILSNLPAKAIQRCRRICKHFLELIDNARNHGLCLGPSIARSLTGIQNDTDLLCDYPTDIVDGKGTSTALLHAMVDFADTARLGDLIAVTQNLPCFARHWLHRCFAGSQDDCDENLPSLMISVFAIVFTAMTSATEGTDAADKTVMDARDHFVTLTRADPDAQRLAKIPSTTSFDRLLSAVPHTGLAFMMSDRAAASDHEQKCLRFQPHIADHGDDPMARLHRLNDHTMDQRLEALLDLPALANTSPVTYCVKSDWAMNEISTLLQRRVSTDPSLPEWGFSDTSAIIECGQRLSRIKKAALLEDIIIG